MPEALPMRLFISLSNDALDATFEPRYTKFFTFLKSLPLILIDGKLYVPCLRTLVFLRLIVRPKSEHADETDSVVSVGLGQSKPRVQHHQ